MGAERRESMGLEEGHAFWLGDFIVSGPFQGP